MTPEQRINALRPGRELVLSRGTDGYVTVERSGDGRTLRWVRHRSDACEVIWRERR